MPGVKLSDLHLRQGEILVVAGRPGAGKTRLLGTATGGRFALVRGSAAQRRPEVHGLHLDLRRTLRGNLEAVVESAAPGGPRRVQLDDAVDLFELAPFLNRRLADVPLDVLRRAGVAMAALAGPDAVLLDEPARGLPATARAPLRETLRSALEQSGLTAVYATEDPTDAIVLGDRIAYVEEGRIRQVGTAGELAAHPATADLLRFIGRDRVKIVPAKVHGDDLELPDATLTIRAPAPAPTPGDEVLVGLWPEQPDAVPVFEPKSGEALTYAARPEAEAPAAEAVGADGGAAPAARVVNVELHEHGGDDVLAMTDPLRPGATYDLWLDIGRRRAQSVVVNARDHAFPELPETPGGHDLEVVIDGSGVEVGTTTLTLRLPNHGDSDRRSVTVEVPEEPGTGSVRIAFYWRRHLLQSVLLSLVWGRRARRSHEGNVDYSLSSLDDVGRLPERDLNLLLNDNGDGRHRVIVNGHDDEAFVVKPMEDEMTLRLGAVRDALVRAHAGDTDKSLYDERNAKTPDELFADLHGLATVGARLLGAVMQAKARKRLRATLAAAPGGIATIQVIPAAGRKLMFPWHLVYDLELEVFDTDWVPCEFLKGLDTTKPFAGFPATCPHEDSHAGGVICPYGFWGFRHLVEMPPPVEEGDLPLCVRDEPPAARVAVGLATTLVPRITREHLARLPPPFADLERCESKEAFEEALAADERELVYLYCHGREDKVRAHGGTATVLELGKEDFLDADDIIQWADHRWGDDHWANTAPLVLINGCGTVGFSPVQPGDFVDPFVGAGAAGVIGTEVAMDQAVAAEAAEEFLLRLAEPGATVGGALRGMRHHLIAKGNVMGLAYTPYCSSSLKLRCDGVP